MQQYNVTKDDSPSPRYINTYNTTQVASKLMSLSHVRIFPLVVVQTTKETQSEAFTHQILLQGKAWTQRPLRTSMNEHQFFIPSKPPTQFVTAP